MAINPRALHGPSQASTRTTAHTCDFTLAAGTRAWGRRRALSALQTLRPEDRIRGGGRRRDSRRTPSRIRRGDVRDDLRPHGRVQRFDGHRSNFTATVCLPTVQTSRSPRRWSKTRALRRLRDLRIRRCSAPLKSRPSQRSRYPFRWPLSGPLTLIKQRSFRPVTSDQPKRPSRPIPVEKPRKCAVPRDRVELSTHGFSVRCSTS